MKEYTTSNDDSYERMVDLQNWHNSYRERRMNDDNSNRAGHVSSELQIDNNPLISIPSTLFEDRFVRLTPTVLTVKTYWFPLCTSRDFPLDKIRAIYHRKATMSSKINDNASCWLCSCSYYDCTWWALDFGRDCRLLGGPKSDTVRMEIAGEQSLKGFSVSNLDGFLQAISAALSPHVLIGNDEA